VNAPIVTRPILLSAVSGCVWAAIVWVLIDHRINTVIGAGLLASPLIGVLMGRFSTGFNLRTVLKRAVIALGTLYFSAILFAIAMGVADYLSPDILRGPRALTAVIVETVWFVLFGLTYTGYVIVLWPLAYLNHSLIARTS
jgi:hypothetical protein